MKKKITIITTVFVLAFCIALLLAGCNCRHQVNKWKTITEATCTTQGVRRGVCVECGEVIEEATEINPENHVFDEWEIVKMPSVSRDGTGLATKTCKENPEHSISVTLPRLYNGNNAGTGYTAYEMIKEATVLEEGKISAVLSHESGDIVFTIPIKKLEFVADINDKEVCTVGNAVLLASSNREQIRRGSGIKDTGWGDDDGKGSVFTYEFADDYCHTYDESDNQELWVSRTSKGEIFGVVRHTDIDGNTEIKQYAKAKEENLEGYAYYISFVGRNFYGAEGLLLNSYIWGSRNDNNDFWEGKEATADGDILYKFRFGYYSAPRYFFKIEVEFKMTDTLALRYIQVTTKTYLSAEGQFTVSYDDANGTICTLNGKQEARNTECIYFNQVTKEEDPVEVVKDYTEDQFNISSFTTYYRTDDGYLEKVTDDVDNAPHFPTGSGDNNIVIKISDIKPKKATLEYDALTVYLVDSNGRRKKMDFAASGGGSVWCYIDEKASTITIRSKLAGYLTILLRTESGYEKTIVLYADYSAPQIIYPSVYEYSDAGYSWRTSENTEIETTVYTGQSFTFKASIEEEETYYADAGFAARILSAEGASTADATITKYAEDPTASFVASKAGKYVVQLYSTKQPAISAKVTVVVEEAPELETLLYGEYRGTLKKTTAEVSFGATGTDGKTQVTISTYNKKGEFEATEVLTVYYDYDNDILISEHASGASLGMKIELNEAYRLVLSSPTGFGSGKEKCILFRPEPEEGESQGSEE